MFQPRIGVRAQPQETAQTPTPSLQDVELLELELLALDEVDSDAGQGGAGSASFQKLQNWQPGQTKPGTDQSTVQGDPPADLAPPPGTTAQQLYNQNPQVFDDINKMKWKGTKEGDVFAQNNGFKNFDDMKNSDSPKAAQAMAKLQWVGTAANNAGIQDSDGTHARSAKLQGDGLTGIRGSGEVDPHSTAAIAQDYIVHGESMNGKTTKATDRVYADGTCKSNAHMVMKKIGDAIGKVIPWVKLATDAGDNQSDINHANKVDDKQTAKDDKKKFGKMIGNFFKEEAELVATAIPGVGPELMAAAKAAEIGVEVGTTAARTAEEAGRGAEEAGQAGRGAEEAGQAGRGAEEAGDSAGSVGRSRPGPEDPASAGRWDSVMTKFGNWLKAKGDVPPATAKDMAMAFIKKEFKDQLKDELKDKLEEELNNQFNTPDSYLNQQLSANFGVTVTRPSADVPGGYSLPHLPVEIAAAG